MGADYRGRAEYEQRERDRNTIAAQEERIRQLRNGLEGYAEQWHRVYCDKTTVFAACQREICIEARALLAETVVVLGCTCPAGESETAPEMWCPQHG